MMNTRRVQCATIVCVLGLLVLILAGCTNKPKPQDPFLEKWRRMAEQAQGHSPTLKSRTVDLEEASQLPEILGDEQVVEKPLPKVLVSMDYRDANIVAVIQALAKHVNQSVMLSPNVTGRVTVNIIKKPWDQVFEGILRTNGLTYSWEGDILRVMTPEDMNRDLQIMEARNKQQAQRNVSKSVEPLLTSVIEIKYAQATKLQENLQAYLNAGVAEGETARSTVQVDSETNALIVQAVRADMEKVFRLVDKLDRPRKQIKIKGYIVETTTDIARQLGVRWGAEYFTTYDGNQLWVTPGGVNGEAENGLLTWEHVGNEGMSGTGYINDFDIDANIAGGSSLNFLFGDFLGGMLDVQLNALQEDNEVNILSSPSITTLDNEMAYTENGQSIPYTTLDDSGETKVEYKDAVLRLEIVPHIIDSDYLRMKILLINDTVIASAAGGNPSIRTSSTETTLICRNKETVVISGLVKRQGLEGETGVPGLKDVPLLGWLFKSETKGEDSQEVLIFITPTILDEWRPGEVQKSLDEIEEDIRQDAEDPITDQ